MQKIIRTNHCHQTVSSDLQFSILLGTWFQGRKLKKIFLHISYHFEIKKTSRWQFSRILNTLQYKMTFGIKSFTPLLPNMIIIKKKLKFGNFVLNVFTVICSACLLCVSWCIFHNCI